LQIEKDVKQRGINRVHFVGAKIPQKLVDVLQTRREVVTVLKIYCRKSLPRMGVHERQGSPVRRRSVGGSERCENERGDSAKEPTAVKVAAVA
jgi:hypothetical protein